MKVTMLTHTPEPERTVACAAKLCYSKKISISSLWESLADYGEVEKFLKKLIANNHQSPLEHISFTFAIEDVSRATLAQLSRHRIGISLSVRSQRYCNEGEFKAIPPKKIENNKEALDEFNMLMEQLKCEYNYLQYKYSLSNEDARAILPNACATRMIVTMNARELLHFFNERCCTRAQNEIRTLAYKMLALCKSIAPIIFENAGAKCATLGYCPESNMSCGKKPTLDKIMEVYNANV